MDVDKTKDAVKRDPRLILDGKKPAENDNANYLWIQYFYNYLKPPSTSSRGGRAGFVIASSASVGTQWKKEIQVKTGAVDVMMAIGNNFLHPFIALYPLVLTVPKKTATKSDKSTDAGCPKNLPQSYQQGKRL